METMKTVYLVWNEDFSECVGFDVKEDAIWTATGSYPAGYKSLGVPSIGEAFREAYAEDVDTLKVSETTVIHPV